jgi:hypothetical protein
MSEFEFDEKIEISTNVDGKRIFADVDGYLIGTTYARKIEPKVNVVLYCEGSTAQTRYIPQSLADKILAREV